MVKCLLHLANYNTVLTELISVLQLATSTMEMNVGTVAGCLSNGAFCSFAHRCFFSCPGYGNGADSSSLKQPQ